MGRALLAAFAVVLIAAAVAAQQPLFHAAQAVIARSAGPQPCVAE